MNYCKQIQEIIDLLGGGSSSSNNKQNSLQTICVGAGDYINLTGLSEFSLSILKGEFTLMNTDGFDFSNNVIPSPGSSNVTNEFITLSSDGTSTTPSTSGAPKGYESGNISGKTYQINCITDGCFELDVTKLV